jgi:hypothetical protein
MKKNGFEKLLQICCRNEWFWDSELLSRRFDRDKVRFFQWIVQDIGFLGNFVEKTNNWEISGVINLGNNLIVQIRNYQ